MFPVYIHLHLIILTFHLEIYNKFIISNLILLYISTKDNCYLPSSKCWLLDNYEEKICASCYYMSSSKASFLGKNSKPFLVFTKESQLLGFFFFFFFGAPIYLFIIIFKNNNENIPSTTLNKPNGIDLASYYN